MAGMGTVDVAGAPAPDPGLNLQTASFPKISKELLRADLERMQAGELGMSEAERRQIVANQRLQASAENAALQSALAQQALAGGGGLQGQQLTALRSGQEATAQAAARGAAVADEASRQQALAEAARIRDDLHAQQERARQNAQAYTGMALGAVGGTLTAPESSVLGGALQGAEPEEVVE